MRAQSLVLLDTREPLLLRITPDRGAAERAGRARHVDGAQPVPVRAAPWRSSSSRWCRRRWCRCSATGRSPARWRRSAGALGYRVDGGRSGPRSAGARRAWWSPRTAATRWTCSAAALDAGVPYIGLVASRKRGGGRAGRAGRRPAATARTPGRVHTPAGLDIGARTPGGDRAVDPGRGGRRRGRIGGPDGRAAASRTAQRSAAAGHGGRPGLRHDGRRGRDERCTSTTRARRYYFCGPGCLRAFSADPAAFLTARRGAAVTDPLAAAIPDVRHPARRCSTSPATWPTRGSRPRCSVPYGCGQPILLEGEAGVGKTSAAKALAAALDTPLIRLQCYEGIDIAEAAVRVELPAAAARDPAGRGRRQRARRGRPVRPRLPASTGRCCARSSTPGRCPPCC